VDSVSLFWMPRGNRPNLSLLNPALKTSDNPSQESWLFSQGPSEYIPSSANSYPTNSLNTYLLTTNNFIEIIIIIIIIYFDCKWVFTWWQWYYNTQITHITQNNTTIKRNTAHKTTHRINTLQRMDTTITTTIYKLVLTKISLPYTKHKPAIHYILN
jgi:hypothetical protein